MFIVNDDGTIYATRGDIGSIEVGMQDTKNAGHGFKRGDIVRLNVHEAKRTDRVVILKDVEVDVDTSTVAISLSREDTKIGALINRPVDYWYEIEKNPDTTPQTLVGYDVDGPKLFKLFPEGADELCK